MNTEQIENRIKGLTAERSSLEASHNALVQENQKINQEFQRTVSENQTRFAQLTGAINELKLLMQPTAETTNERTDNHDNSIPITDRRNRPVNVRAGK